MKHRTQMAGLKWLTGLWMAGTVFYALSGQGAVGGFDFSSGVAGCDQAYQKCGAHRAFSR